MGSRIQYNGIVINNCKSLLFEYEAARDDSGTDRMYDTYRVAVEGIVVASPSMSFPASDSGDVGVYGIMGVNASQSLLAALALLKQDRKDFKYTMDGETLLEVTGDEIPDCDNGPKVQRVKVVHFTPHAYRIQFEIVVAKNPCGGSILSNRWAAADNIDDNHRTTRVWRGRLRVASANVDPQDFRRLCLPSILKGWRRRSMHFTGEPNGLELTYEIADEQMLGDSPPWPAIRMSGTHIETLTMHALNTVSEVNVRLDGEPGTDRQQLIMAGLTVLDAKLHFANFLQAASSGRPFTGWIRSLFIAEYFGDSVNAIEVKATVQRFKDDNSVDPIKLGNLIGETLGKPLEMQSYDRFRPIAPSAYPSSLANLFACYLQTPCSNHAMPQGQIPQGNNEPTEEDDAEQPVATYNPSAPTIEISAPVYSDEHKQFIYTHASVESQYDIDNGVIGCPIAKPPGTSGPSTAFIRVAPPTAIRTVRLGLERLGKTPASYRAKEFVDRNGIKHVPKRSTSLLRPEEPTGDSQVMYGLDQTIVFLLDREPTPEQMSMGSLPWHDAPPTNLVADEIIEPDDQQKGI